MTPNEWESLKSRVVTWAQKNNSVEYQHNAPYVWWRSALSHEVISNAEFEYAKRQYANMWNYVGD